MQLWPGSYMYKFFTFQALKKLKTTPEALIVAHPECVKTVRDFANEVCSTEKMIHFCQESSADTFIIVTETGMIHRLQREIPHKTFIAGPTNTCACNECRFMKMNTTEKLRDCLRDLSPAIEIPEPIREHAYAPLKRMSSGANKSKNDLLKCLIDQPTIKETPFVHSFMGF